MGTTAVDRFWLTAVGDEDTPAFLPGWWGVVDEEAGGIIAAAATKETAEIIRSHFADRAGLR
jgi:hypothetical protein